MLGSIILLEVMLPVAKPVGEVVHRLRTTGIPARGSKLLPRARVEIPTSQTVRLKTQGFAPFPRLRVGGLPEPVRKGVANAAPAADLVYGLRVVSKPKVTEQRYSLPPVELSAFPVQYSWLRTFYHGTVQELCVVALADAPAGNRITIFKGGTNYAVYLVPTTDSNASPVRVNTTAGVKAIRKKT